MIITWSSFLFFISFLFEDNFLFIHDRKQKGQKQS